MFIPSNQDAHASTASAASTSPSAVIPSSTLSLPQGQVRHLLLGPPSAVHSTILLLHKLGYAGPNDWSRAIAMGKPNEVMAILTKRVSVSASPE
ncbi:hypothetical protein [cf. Phormidesmis sp. LEGE 11477]|uniref:hypothetical protein n=1 Tax=cf. Phormidesmis sp. LEGE 11477 TaxID=1828680 RepID=UPI0018814DA5|nr:hypothetical protein [cf. Phormidesmis sp. LEGE 11477]MBE9061932.1 hypothetical protein [cf. Phormidesmis sp. LEGE 11477]